MSEVRAEDDQRRVIQNNVRLWHRQRRRRAVAKERKTFNTHFNSVVEAMKGRLT